MNHYELKDGAYRLKNPNETMRSDSGYSVTKETAERIFFNAFKECPLRFFETEQYPEEMTNLQRAFNELLNGDCVLVKIEEVGNGAVVIHPRGLFNGIEAAFKNGFDVDEDVEAVRVITTCGEKAIEVLKMKRALYKLFEDLEIKRGSEEDE